MTSVEGIIASKVSMESLLAGVFSGAAILLVEGKGMPGVAEVMGAALSVGAPVTASALLLNYLTDKTTMPPMTFQMVRAVVGGGMSAALMVLVGEIPAKIDASTITFAAVAGLSILAADYIAEKVHGL